MRKRKLKGRYSEEIRNKICELIKTDSYTIAEMCNVVGISERSFYKWQKEKADFAEAIKEARHYFEQETLMECERSLIKLIKGYTVSEKRITTTNSGKTNEYGNPIPRIKEQITTEKHITPNLGAIIHYQTNRDPTRWKNKQSVDMNASVNPVSRMTNEEINEAISKIKENINDET